MDCDRIDVIVPAYNGAATLAATLAALAVQVSSCDRVHVVLNGCTDGSEAVAKHGLSLVRAAGADGSLISCSETGRCAALSAGDAVAEGHRLYLDQDARLGLGGLDLIRAAFRDNVHFVCGDAVWRTSSTAVGSAMQAWNRLPYVREAGVTAGMYGVSLSGRGRWCEWPNGLPDDKWARLHFSPPERKRLVGLSYSVDAPESFRGLVMARRRYREYNLALTAAVPELLANDIARRTGLIAFALNPRNLPGSGILALAEVMARAHFYRSPKS